MFFSAAILLLVAQSASAHQPNIIGARTHIEVLEPEVSKAYYAELPGEPAVYEIRSNEPFVLYVNILAPDIPGASTDFTVEIFKDGELFAALDSTMQEWRRFYEPFGGDSYLQGPVYKNRVGGGTYDILVSNPARAGKYVLAVGEREEFPPAKMLHALLALPRLKKDFFGKSPWTALNSRIGVFLLAFIGVIALAFLLILTGARRIRMARKRSGGNA